MVELFEERAHRPGDAGVIVNPADFGIDLSDNTDLNLETIHSFGFELNS